jgi:prevent-host-death family protein
VQVPVGELTSLFRAEIPRGRHTSALHWDVGIYVQIVTYVLYTVVMEVAISELRAHLSEWLERARGGSEIVVTDRGIPVARLLGVDASETLRRLTEEGVIARPSNSVRPQATGRRRAKTTSSVADLVGEQRR